MVAETEVSTANVPLAQKVDSPASGLDHSHTWVDLEAGRHRMTLDALDDVDAGRLIKHQEILGWVGGLEPDKPPPIG